MGWLSDKFGLCPLTDEEQRMFAFLAADAGLRMDEAVALARLEPKPRIRRFLGAWACSVGGRGMAIGRSPSEAYYDWRFQKLAYAEEDAWHQKVKPRSQGFASK